jgi:hypothetical protein
VRNRTGEHAFSIEMRSKEFVRHISMSDKAQDPVLIEGFLGELEEIGIVESSMLEVRGANGVLRMDFNEEELSRLLPKGGAKEESLT